MSTNIEIIVGTYEEFLLGYKLDYKNGEKVLSQSFADKSHTGAIKCLSVHGKFIATGGTDDRIFIYDMKTRKQSQILLNHEGTVNSIDFTSDDTHILSAGDDGRMVAVRVNTWHVGANWKKAHNGSAVTHISCHPSGKLALSLGTDLVLRTWNLVKGRVAYKTNLKNKASLGSTPDCLAWSTEGSYFTIAGQRELEIWCIKKADVLISEKTKSKPICVCWASDSLVLVGLEDGSILFVSTEDGEETVNVNAHKSRVKAMCISGDILVSASSSGDVKMWTLDIANRKIVQIAATNVGCRPTCIGILDLEQFGNDYGEKNVPVQKENIVKTKVETKFKQARGVVTIEYDDEENKDEVNDSDDKEEDKSNSDDDDEEGTEEDASINSDDDDEDVDDEEEEEVKPVKQKATGKKRKYNDRKTVTKQSPGNPGGKEAKKTKNRTHALGNKR